LFLPVYDFVADGSSSRTATAATRAAPRPLPSSDNIRSNCEHRDDSSVPRYTKQSGLVDPRVRSNISIHISDRKDYLTLPRPPPVFVRRFKYRYTNDDAATVRCARPKQNHDTPAFINRDPSSQTESEISASPPGRSHTRRDIGRTENIET